jgi:hypothetical protein
MNNCRAWVGCFGHAPRQASCSWSNEAIETAKRLLAEGKSAEEIACELSAERPGTTRNAVIGKLHRLRCAGGGRQPNKNKSRPPRLDQPPVERRAQVAEAMARAAVRFKELGWDLRPTSPGARIGRGVRSEKRAAPHRIERKASTSKRSKWISIVDLEDTSCR